MTARSTRKLLAITAAGVTALALVVTALSQSASGFDLSWRGAFGGGSSSGGGYVAQGVIGQPFTASSSAASYQVGSGFLGGGAVKFKRFLPALSNDGTP